MYRTSTTPYRINADQHTKQGDDAPLRMITDQILLKHVGTFPGLDYYETQWTYDCKLVRYEDLLILRFRPKVRVQ